MSSPTARTRARPGATASERAAAEGPIKNAGAGRPSFQRFRQGQRFTCRLGLIFGRITAIVEISFTLMLPQTQVAENILGVIVGESRSFLFTFTKLAYALHWPASAW
jgi:hypothetical protein